MWFDPWPCSVGWGSGVAMNCGVGCRRGLDSTLLWLWRRPAAAAPIRPLAWEPPCAASAALKKKKKQAKQNKKSSFLGLQNKALNPQRHQRSFFRESPPPNETDLHVNLYSPVSSAAAHLPHLTFPDLLGSPHLRSLLSPSAPSKPCSSHLPCADSWSSPPPPILFLL